MGYYTNYELELSESKPSDFDDNFRKITGYDSGCLENIKWYSHNEDMLTISEIYPNILFTLKGEGEENGDLWINYYKNGKVQVAKAIITYEAFDESKLK